MNFQQATAHQIAMSSGRNIPNAKDIAAADAAIERFTARRSELGLAPFKDTDGIVVSVQEIETTGGDYGL